MFIILYWYQWCPYEIRWLSIVFVGGCVQMEVEMFLPIYLPPVPAVPKHVCWQHPDHGSHVLLRYEPPITPRVAEHGTVQPDWCGPRCSKISPCLYNSGSKMGELVYVFGWDSIFHQDNVQFILYIKTRKNRTVIFYCWTWKQLRFGRSNCCCTCQS